MSAPFASIEASLEKNLPPEELSEVRRILYGKELAPVKLSSKTESLAASEDFEVAGYAFTASAETTRPARVVRIGAIQNQIVAPTSAPVAVQKKALFERLGKMVDAAGESGVNVLCLQEAWSKKLWKIFLISFDLVLFSYAVCVLHPREGALVRVCRGRLRGRVYKVSLYGRLGLNATNEPK